MLLGEKMNLATTIALVYLIFITVEQLSGSSFREKRGSCPMYKVMTGGSLCEQEEAECDTDFVCRGDLKCCEDERCGVSKCVKPVIKVINPVISSSELCPVEDAPYNAWGCRRIETKFCYIINCARCCTHKTNCNPAKGVLLPHDKCQMADLRPSITYDKNVVQNGDTLRLSCQPKYSKSFVAWEKAVKGKLLTLPSSMTSRAQEQFNLEIKNATVGDSGHYSCKVIYGKKTYYKEISVTVRRPDNQDVCVLPFNSGLCNGNVTRYYYDIKDDSCKTFNFFGCKGNNNNFIFKTECEKKCRGSKLECPSSGISRYEKCSPAQKHDCQSNENCGYRETCCLIGCSRMCIDPSKPWTTPMTATKSAPSTEPPTPSVPTVPCGKLVCKHFAECQTNASGGKECVCPKACSFAAIHPICGKDVSTGRRITYPSMCFLKIRSCRSQRPVVLVRLGRCANFGILLRKPKDPCKVKQCSPYATCVINRFNGQPQCLCPRFCSFVPRKVCGSDGRTYHNDCMLKVLSCRKKLYVKIDHYGPCNRL